MMTCDEVRTFLDEWYVGDLVVPHSPAVERHIEECAGCAALSSARAVLNEVMIERAALSRGGFEAGVSRRRDRGSDRTVAMLVRWLALIASLALLAIVTWSLSTRSATVQPSLTHEIVSDHIRSLMANHILDIASADSHALQSWFTGKLDYAMPVSDLASAGYSLAGGRLDYVDSHPVAATVYQDRAHIINVFAWPTREDDAAQQQPRLSDDHGYHLAEWTSAGLTYFAISDVDASELARLASLLGAK